MSTSERRYGGIPLAGAGLLAVLCAVSGCSGPAKDAGTTPASSATVMNSSSRTGSAAPAATGPAPSPSSGRSHTSPPRSAATTAPASPSGTRAIVSPAAAPAPVAHLVPSCKPGQFARQTGLARGALDVYLFRPYDAGAMHGTGTKAALALLHGGQAVRFSTQQLVAARGSLATCSAGVRPLVAALDTEIGQLRALGTAFQANHAPGSAAMTAARSSLSATTRAAVAAGMAPADAVPTAVQIETGN
jgi:hypothetical protein